MDDIMMMQTTLSLTRVYILSLLLVVC
jgi:hypothetical protein